MDDKSKKQDDSDLDELQKNIEESAEEAVKIPVASHETPEDESNDKKEQSESDDTEKKEDAEDAEEKQDDSKDDTENDDEKESDDDTEAEVEETSDEAAEDTDKEDNSDDGKSEEEESSDDEESEESEEESNAEDDTPREDKDDNESEDDVEETKRAGPAGPYEPNVPDADGEPTIVEEKAEDTAKDSPKNDSQDKAKTVDEAVDDMLSVEPQEAQAAAVAAAEAAKNKKGRSLRSKIASFFRKWWRNKKARYATLVALFLLFTAVVFVPQARYTALNLVGVRVNSSLTVIDSQTGLPLENIPVSLAGQEKRSGDDGQVEFSNLKLGSSTLIIDKLGYADYEKELTLGLGSNPLGPQSLIATGAQYRFRLIDWQSRASLTEAEAKSGEDIAKADPQGRIQLTVGNLSDGAEVSIAADGYRVETFQISDLDEEEQTLAMVPGKKHVFVSNRSGDYDLYKIDVDGQSEEILLAATGDEREIPFVLPHQQRNIAAYISSRDGERNGDGFILDGLFIVNVDTGEVERVTRSEQLQIIGWLDNKLVYVAVVEGVSAGNPQRSRIFSYDVDTGERRELAASNYFNDVELVGQDVYYAVSSAAVPQSQAKLFSVDVDGNNKQTVVDTQVWSIVRTDFDKVLLNAIDREWYEQQLGQAAQKLDTEPSNRTNKDYVLSPNGEQAVWTDVRDGRGVLLLYSVPDNSEGAIQTVSGLTVPVYWLNDNYVVYRVETSAETADYVLNLNGGQAQKISDVVGNRSRYFY